MRGFVAFFAAAVAAGASAQSVEIANVVSSAHVRANDSFAPRALATPIPLQNFSVSRGIGVVEDDGNSYWPGFPANFQAPATFRLTPTANNTFTAQRVAFQFDDPSLAATTIFSAAARPILTYVDASYRTYTLPSPITFAGKQYTKLSVSLWGAVAFGDANSAEVNYDPTVVSSMFRIPMVAAWYELFWYPYDARIVARAKSNSVVITWQNLLGRHSATRATFQVELFQNGEIQLSYQSLPADHGLVGVSTGTETVTRQTANAVAATDLPLGMQAAGATFDDYSGVIAGVTLKLAAAPAPAANETYRYSLLINGIEAVGVQKSGGNTPAIIILNGKIPDFPVAQINSWELKLTGDTLSFRFPATSLEPFLTAGLNTWAIKSSRTGGAGFVERTVTQTLPLNFTPRHTLLPSQVGSSAELPAQIFHYMPGVWDADRIRESVAAYLVSRGINHDTFRFFPTRYDDGLRHTNFAGTYPRQKSVTGIGTIPARTECDCHYGAEHSAVSESLADEATTQVALTHELVHEYGMYADYRDAGGTVTGAWRDAGIPCFGGAHPNNGLVNRPMYNELNAPAQISVMGGSLNGVFDANVPRYGISPLEMYLMGLAGPADVKPVRFVEGSKSTDITIDQVIAANGPRVPAYNGQLRIFRVPSFVVKRKGEATDDAQLQQLQLLHFRWQTRFWRETGGRARVNVAADTSCSFTLEQYKFAAAATPGTGRLNVLGDSGCAWTTTGAPSWLTINSGSGNGSGQIRWTLAPNPGIGARSATISVAGQPVTITQAGVERHRAVKP